jgi:hypothetical protein
MNFETKLIKKLENWHVIFFLYNYQHQGHESFSYLEFVIFSRMAIDEIVQMVGL